LEELRLQSTSFWDVYDFRDIPYQGYELCTFRDSGSFIWGVVDDYFGAKIESPKQVLRYTGDTVLLWAHAWDHRLISSYTNDPPILMNFQCSHYGKKPIRNGVFTWEIRGKGLKIRSEPKVNILHSGSLATGFLSPLMEYYLRRNRWVFIRRYFPKHLRRQILRFLFYQNQKLFFRFRMGHLRLEWLAFRDFCRGRMNQAQEHHSGGRS